jgi:hypothetical protein
MMNLTCGVSEQTQKEILIGTTKETQATDNAIPEKIAKDYIIERMARSLNLELHEGPGDRDVRSIYTSGNRAIIVADPATLTI